MTILKQGSMKLKVTLTLIKSEALKRIVSMQGLMECNTGCGPELNTISPVFQCMHAYFLFRLVYDTTTNIYRNNDGVTIRVPGFGGTETVEFTNTDNLIRVPGFNDFVQYFVDRGYVRGETIRAAPYDWRLAAG